MEVRGFTIALFLRGAARRVSSTALAVWCRGAGVHDQAQAQNTGRSSY